MAASSASKSRSTIQAVSRSLDLLEALTSRDEVALGELSQATGLLPSTAHRLLATLGARGYVAKNPSTGRYLLGYKLLELGSHVARRRALLRALARPHLEKIQADVRETSNLVVLNGTRAVYIDQVEGIHAVRMFAAIGGEFAAHTTGAGKAMLAFSDQEAVRAMVEDPSFGMQLTENTLLTREALESDLRRTRRRGYAIDNEEHEHGVICVAAPVFGHDGQSCAALSVSGPVVRIRRRGVEAVAALLCAEAAEVSVSLGHPPAAVS